MLHVLMGGLVFKVALLSIYPLSVEHCVNIMAARDVTGTWIAIEIDATAT